MNSAFSAAQHHAPSDTLEYAGRMVPRRFAPAAQEYANARERVALFDRSDRGLLEVTGRDRQSWLHNLVTNAVKTVPAGAGVYAFALDVKGRILFDMNIMVLAERVWIDVDAAFAAIAYRHLERYHISEDVKLTDQSAAHARLGVAGPESPRIAAALEAAVLAEMPLLSQSTVSPDGLLIRNDFTGQTGFELLAAAGDAAKWWDRIAGDLQVSPAGFATLDALRIETGIPWMGRDLDEKVVAPETGQVARAVSYNKGCYLGQEVVERMRSHGALPRRLVRLICDGGPELNLPTPILRDGADVGRLTSLVEHPQGGRRIGLGYLKSAVTDDAGLTVGDPPTPLRFPPA